VVQDDQMTQPWSLLNAGTPFFTLSRAHHASELRPQPLIHHRPILCVYLRLNNILFPECMTRPG